VENSTKDTRYGLGTVLSVYIAPAAVAPMKSVVSVQAWASKGLEGDRYAAQLGTYSNHPGNGRDVTLIEIEAIEGLQRAYQVALEPALSRRNIITRGVALNHLVEQEFQIGEVWLRGTRLCEPCIHLERLSVKGSMQGLIHRGGLRAEVIRAGVIKVGDEITTRIRSEG
jgi:MOSC domain-containing protein YiiM